MKFLIRLNNRPWLLVRRVKGQSMMPTLRDGQIILAIGVWPHRIEGRVIIARQNHREVVKRVKWFKNNRIFLVGDNNSFSQDSRIYGPIKKNDYLGLVIWPRLPN